MPEKLSSTIEMIKPLDKKAMVEAQARQDILTKPPGGLTLETIRSVERMDIPDTDKDKIFERNAVKLLRVAI